MSALFKILMGLSLLYYATAAAAFENHTEIDDMLSNYLSEIENATR